MAGSRPDRRQVAAWAGPGHFWDSSGHCGTGLIVL